MLLCPTVEQHFPFMNKDVNIQVIYIRNLLRILTYFPVQRSRFLEIILSKLIRMDVNLIFHSFDFISFLSLSPRFMHLVKISSMLKNPILKMI